MKTFITSTLFLSLVCPATQALAKDTTSPDLVISTQQIEKIDNLEVSIESSFPTFENAAIIENDYQQVYENTTQTKLEYDIVNDVDLNIGLIKTKKHERRFNVRPATLPRGRTFRPVRSKLGAGITRSF